MSTASGKIIGVVSRRDFNSTSSKSHINEHAITNDGDLTILERMLQHFPVQMLQARAKRYCSDESGEPC